MHGGGRLADNVTLESFCEGLHLKEMKKGRFYSCSGQAKVPLVSAFDVAAVAYHALLNVKSFDCDYRILGPDHYTYDQVCSLDLRHPSD